jgi:hypothetical protein
MAQSKSIMGLLQSTVSGAALQFGADLQLIVQNALSGLGGLVAGAAGSIGAATPQLKAAINEVTTVGVANGSVAMPPAIAGASFFAINSGANSMTAYALPSNGATGAADVIEPLAGGATVTSIAIPAAAVGLFICATAGRWKSVFQ